MPAPLLFTANAGTDQLAITAHGLVTGDGPGTPRAYGGVLPAPLVGLTDYWIIRDSADLVRLATSSANALLGTAINLTTNGSGLLYLELGIPYRRARTYVPRAVDVAAAQLKSADLNAFQDSLKALHALLTGQVQSVWSAPAILPDSKTVYPRPIHASNWAMTGATVVDGTMLFKSSAAGYAEFCLSDYMHDGQTLKDLRLWLTGDGAVDVTAKVITVDYNTPLTSVVSTVVSNNVPAAAITFLDFTALNIVASQLNRIWLRVECNAANAEMSAIILEFPP